MKAHRNILNSLISKDYCTVKEIADVIDKSDKTVYNFLEGQRDLSAEDFIKIATYLSNKGHNQFAHILIAPVYTISRKGEVTINGTIEKDIISIVELTADVNRSFNTDSWQEGIEGCRDIRLKADKIEAEFKQRKLS